MAKLKSELELRCPCCNAMLVVDTNLGRIVSHKEPERGDKPELTEAARILAEEARRREALFEQSVEAEKTRGDALARERQGPCARPRRSPFPSRCETSISIKTLGVLAVSPNVRRQLGPAIAPRVELPRFVAMSFAERAVLRTPALLAFLRPLDAPVRPVE